MEEWKLWSSEECVRDLLNGEDSYFRFGIAL